MTRVGKKGKNHGLGIAGIRQRELGELSPRNFARRAGASKDLVLRLGIHRKLNRHRGCVNTVSFNADGDILLSGSDDRMVILWDWDTGKVKLSFHSCHRDNIFQARFMPYTNDRTLVTCAADGEVRHAQIHESGEVSTALLAQHEGRVHKMAIDPGSSHIFYSCGEDGLVQHFDLRTKSATKLFLCKHIKDGSPYFGPIVPLNAIAINSRNANHFAIGGRDPYARLFDIRRLKWDCSSAFGLPTDCFFPQKLVGIREDEITGLAFSDQGELLASYVYEEIILFSMDQGLGSHSARSSQGSAMHVETGYSNLDSGPQLHAIDVESVAEVYEGHHSREIVKGVNFFGPNCEYVVSGSECGLVFIWRKKDGELLRVIDGDTYAVNCVEPHPYAPTIASSGIENDIKIWIPNAMERAPPVNMGELKRRRPQKYPFKHYEKSCFRSCFLEF